MPEETTPQAAVYEIKLEGQLDARWTDWFEGLSITLDGRGDTILSGPVVDQAALHGLLKKVRDLGMPLISVNRIEDGQTEQPRERERHGTGEVV